MKTISFKSRFESIGITVPEKRFNSKDLVDNELVMQILPKLRRATGIKEKRICSEGEDSYTLSVDASRDCLEYSSYRPGQLEMVVCCSITKYKDGLNAIYEPPLSLYVKEAIGAPEALSFDISNACAGMLTGVYIVDDFIKRGIVRNGIVVSGEYLTSLSENAVKSIQSVKSQQLASLTLGDAGAAVILERVPANEPEELKISCFTTFSQYSNLCTAMASQKNPGAYMLTQTQEINNAASSITPKLLKKALEQCGISLDQVDYIIPHQTSRSSINYGFRHVFNCLNAKPCNVLLNMENYGNTASTSHFLALYRYLKEGRFKRDDRIMLMASASGIVMGFVVFTLNNMVARYGNNY